MKRCISCHHFVWPWQHRGITTVWLFGRPFHGYYHTDCGYIR